MANENTPINQENLGAVLYVKTQEIHAQHKALETMVEKAIESLPIDADHDLQHDLMVIKFLAAGLSYPLSGLQEVINILPEIPANKELEYAHD